MLAIILNSIDLSHSMQLSVLMILVQGHKVTMKQTQFNLPPLPTPSSWTNMKFNVMLDRIICNIPMPLDCKTCVQGKYFHALLAFFHNESISSKPVMMIIATEHYNIIAAWMTLTFSQGFRRTKPQNILFSLSCKVFNWAVGNIV